MDDRWKALGAAGIVWCIDRISKMLVERSISFDRAIRVIPGFFDLVHSENRGVAFGIFDDSPSEWRTILLVIISILGVTAVGIALWTANRLDRRSLWAFALILGGASGNLFDRMVSGRVTDFLRVYVGEHEWPAFNVADSAIVIGCGLLLLSQFRAKRQAANVS